MIRFKRLFILLLTVVASAVPAADLSEVELKILSSMSVSRLAELPASPSNQYADLLDARTFGEKLFFDKRLSGNGELSCGSCHQPDRAFTDGEAKAKGVHRVGRNTQTLLGMAWQRWFYWDGRRDSLWAQALVPFESADEMGGSRTQVLKTIAEDSALKREYEALFGAMKSPVETFEDQHAGPWGDQKIQANWYRLSQEVRDQINQDYAKVGKAIAAYVRYIPVPSTRFDRLIGCLAVGSACAEDAPATADELAGMKLFVHPTKTRCFQCHNGPMLTNGSFHNVGSAFPANKTETTLDFGRQLGVRGVKLDEFNCVGPYSDAPASDCQALRFMNQSGHVPLQGAFKTPTLRSLRQTAPFFHDGRYTNLEQVLEHYQRPPEGQHELLGMDLSDKEIKQLIAFLEMLTTK